MGNWPKPGDGFKTKKTKEKKTKFAPADGVYIRAPTRPLNPSIYTQKNREVIAALPRRAPTCTVTTKTAQILPTITFPNSEQATLQPEIVPERTVTLEHVLTPPRAISDAELELFTTDTDIEICEDRPRTPGKSIPELRQQVEPMQVERSSNRPVVNTPQANRARGPNVQDSRKRDIRKQYHRPPTNPNKQKEYTRPSNYHRQDHNRPGPIRNDRPPRERLGPFVNADASKLHLKDESVNYKFVRPDLVPKRFVSRKAKRAQNELQRAFDWSNSNNKIYQEEIDTPNRNTFRTLYLAHVDLFDANINADVRKQTHAIPALKRLCEEARQRWVRNYWDFCNQFWQRP